MTDANNTKPGDKTPQQVMAEALFDTFDCTEEEASVDAQNLLNKLDELGFVLVIDIEGD